MKEKSKEQIAQIRSMMERIENPRQSLTEAMGREANLLCEAVAGKRVQVTRDEIIDLMNQAAENPKNNGKFASITLVKAGEVYGTKKKWRPNEMQDALNAHNDMADKDWYQKLSAYNQDDAKGANPVQTLIVTQRYVFHWQNADQYDAQYGEYADKRTDLRLKYGLSQMQGDPHNVQQKTDIGPRMNQRGSLALNFNMAGIKPKVTTYLVDDNGSIVDEIPGDIRNAMKKAHTPFKVETEATELLSGPVLDEYTKLRTELEATWQSRQFIFDKTLCMCLAVDGVSYFYINDAVKQPIIKNSEVLVSAEDLVRIAEEQLDETFEAINGFAN